MKGLPPFIQFEQDGRKVILAFEEALAMTRLIHERIEFMRDTRIVLEAHVLSDGTLRAMAWRWADEPADQMRPLPTVTPPESAG
jgi:hypothetical protein